MEQPLIINHDRCMSVRNKNSCEQCPNKKKAGSDYCGIHKRAKFIKRIDEIQPNTYILKEEPKSPRLSNKLITIDEINLVLDWNSNVNFEKYRKIIEYSLNTFKSTDIYGLKKTLVWLQNIELFKKKEIILIQSLVKKWLIYRRKKTNNPDDFGTMEPIISIPNHYYFQYKDVDNFIYGFDIRSLSKIMGSDNKINPYNQSKLPIDNSNFMKKYISKMKYLENMKLSIIHQSAQLTAEQKYRQYLTEVFQMYDMLGQYTNVEWFELLSFKDLKNLYKGAEDMFNYRANLPNNIKLKLLKGGKAFTKCLHQLNSFNESHKRFLQYEILNEFKRFVVEPQDEDDKKLGTNLMLTALVEVSPEAAEALPHLVQSTF